MNMYDYLVWRGDLSFDQSPFNIVDNLFLAYVSYVDFSGIVSSGNNPITLRDACRQYYMTATEQEARESTSFIADAPLIMKEMAASNRFGNIGLSHYIRKIDEKKIEQFSAVHCSIGRNTTYIAFCGTDDTIIGWKEDFMMSYEITASQMDAADYLNRTAVQFNHRYYLGGHSKGGNLALYAGQKASDKVRKKIIAIYNNDGPQLSSFTLDQQGYEKVADRIVTIVPQLSVFGMLFDNGCEKTVVKSSQTLIMQHDPISWQIKVNDFERAEKLSDDSYLVQQGINEFLATIAPREREVFVSQMFDAFDKAGIENTTDFAEKGMPIIIALLKELFSVNKQAKDTFGKLVSIFSRLLSDKAKGYFKRKISEAEKLVSKAVDKVRNIRKKQ
ncbi:MAG: DUF2974 domain-containing protein [Erysipelotrichaceae bacterium]|nr:DUF2974 domain-containing protein [Erysipelotrichaceae bacterium]